MVKVQSKAMQKEYFFFFNCFTGFVVVKVGASLASSEGLCHLC